MTAGDLVLTHPPAASADHAAPVPAFDGDFERRWAAWMTRGRARETRTRRKVLTSAGIVAIAAALAYALFR